MFSRTVQGHLMRFVRAEFGTISEQYFEGSVFGEHLSVTGVGGKPVLDLHCVVSLRSCMLQL